jgi:hypothetical protein
MRLATAVCGLVLSGVGAAVIATPASANWQGNYGGVQYGWVNSNGYANEYLWAKASYYSLAWVGAPQIAKVSCDAVFHDTFAGRVCREGVQYWLRRWTANWPTWTNHGLVLNYWPHATPHFRSARF